MKAFTYFGVIVFGFAATIWSWGPEIHEKMAREMLLHNPEIISAFSQTGWTVNKVADYAKRADGLKLLNPGDFYYTEKEIFPGMWASITDYDRFATDYLKYAWDGKKDMNDGYWLSNNATERVYDVDVTQRQLNDPLWRNSHLNHIPSHVYYGQQLFGVFLHQLADCCVPVDHAPANDRCSNRVFAEARFELDAEKESVNGLSSKYEVATFFSESDYYNKYCKIFYDAMMVHAKDFCNVNNVFIPSGPDMWIAQGCFKDGFKFANVVVLRYLNAVLHKGYATIAPQLIFNRHLANILNPQITIGASYFRMELGLSEVPSSEIRVIAKYFIPDSNNSSRSFVLYDGNWLHQGSQLSGEIRPLMWPSEEIKRTDGTAGNEVKGIFIIDAFCSGFFPYHSSIPVTRGGLVLIRNSSMRQLVNVMRK